MGVSKYFSFSILVIGLLLAANNLSAQQFNEKQVQLIDGKTYYLHKVEKGNTLYSLSKMYSIKVKDLIDENPQLEEGLKIGQVIRVPIKKVDKKLTGGNAPEVKGSTIVHEVIPKETLYGLSKRYGVTVEAIQEANPELKEGLKIGMELKIPLPQEASKGVTEVELKPAEEDSFQLHLVEPKETLYSLAIEYDVNMDSIRLINNGLANGLKVGTTIRIPIMKSENEPVELPEEPDTAESTVLLSETELKNKYLVSVLLPLYLDSNDSIYNNKLNFEKDELYGLSNIGMEFYSGFKKAVDEFESDTLEFGIQIYDVSLDPSNGSSESMQKLTDDPNFVMSDLVIGPFHRKNFKIAADFAKTINKPIITPVPQRGDILTGNPFVIQVHSPVEAEVEYMRGIALNAWKGKNMVLIESNQLRDVILTERFRGIINADTNWEVYHKVNEVVKTARFDVFDTSRLNPLLNDSAENILLMPVQDKAFIGRFMTGLNKLVQDYNIKVVGLDSWNKMGYLEYRYLNNLRVHTMHNQFINYSDTTTERFILDYKTQYKTEPTEWSFLGYDLGKYFLYELAQNGTVFQHHFGDELYQGLSRNFYFRQSSTGNGFKNYGLRLVKVENYQYLEVTP